MSQAVQTLCNKSSISTKTQRRKEVVDDMNTLFEEELATLKTEAKSCFASNQGTVEIRGFCTVPFFHCLGSEHLQKAYCTTHFNYVVSFCDNVIITVH